LALSIREVIILNAKRFIITVIAVFLCFWILDFIIHFIILGPTYQDYKELWRPDMMSKVWIMYISSFVLSLLFVYIFTKGYEGKGLREGIRYGLIIGLLFNGVGAFNQYAVYPISFSLAVKWFVYGMIEFIICGVVAAWLYRPKKS
jgi:hypothetical protein